MFILKEVTFNKNDEMYLKYLNSLSNRFDSFLEDYIFDSSHYEIYHAGNKIGICAIQENKLLTIFYISNEFASLSQKVFKYLLDNYNVKISIFPSCDELFLSNSLDFQKELKIQAYIFQTIDKNVSFSSDLGYRLALESDILDISENIDDMDKDEITELVNKKVMYIFQKDSKFVGIGILENSKCFENTISVGLIVNEKCRQKGYGTTILRTLKAHCINRNITPIAGCWYQNEISKKTLEKAGFITKTRLIVCKF